MVVALLCCLSQPAPAAAQCTPQGLPCVWPMTLKSGQSVSTCQTSTDRGTWCSAVGKQGFWAKCVPCISGCSKDVAPDSSNLCTMDLAGSTQMRMFGFKLTIPTRYALIEYSKCLQANCADMSPNTEPFASMAVVAKTMGMNVNLTCPGSIGGWNGGKSGPLTCSSKATDVKYVGDFINAKLVDGIVFGDLCRHTCHCGSCCGGTGPTCPALPTVAAPAPPPTPAPPPAPIEAGSGLRMSAPAVLIAVLLGAHVAMQEEGWPHEEASAAALL